MCEQTKHHHDCGCEKEAGSQPYSGHCCCHEGADRWPRRYQTKAEEITGLEKYLSEIRQEAQAVEERLADLRG